MFRPTVLLLGVIGAWSCLSAAAAWPENRQAVTTANWELAAQWTPDAVADRLYSLGVEPGWLEDGNRFWYRYETSAGVRYWLVDPERAEKRPLFDHAALAAALGERTGRQVDAAHLELGGLEVVEGAQALRFSMGDARYEYRIGAGELVAVAPPHEVPDHCSVSPDGRLCVFARGNNLVRLDLEDPEAGEIRLTGDGVPGWAWGDPWEVVTDDEPRAVPAVWSPDSRRVAMLRADARKVADYWHVEHLAQPRPTLRTVKYPMPEETVPEWQVWVVDVRSGTQVRIEIERWRDQTLEEFFIEPLWWSGDSATLYFIRRSRNQRMLDLCSADPATGSSRVVVEERLDGMVYARPLVELADGRLLWWGVRDGWGHYSLYGPDGSLIRQLTAGAFNVEDVVAVDEERGVILLSANGREAGRNPYYQHLYRVELNGAPLRLLTPEDADHSVVPSPSHRYLVDRFARVDQPDRSVLRTWDGELVMELETADISGLTEDGWRPPELFVALSADGVTEQWGVMWKPFDFDPGNSYPIATRVYPGRMEEFIPKRFQVVNTEATLAQLGCIVVRFGNRGGTRLRGHAYREYARDEFRDYGLADKRAVLEQLAERFPFIDLDRVGIYGGSSGGFMTVSAMLVHPDFFDVGVAMTGPHDPSIQSAEWVERYAGVEWVADEGGAGRWKAARAESNVEIADRLKGRLLMIYGSEDEVVPLSHLHRMADALIKANKRFDQFIMPGTGHDLSPWRYTYGMLWTFFAEHLIGDPRPGLEVFPSGEGDQLDP